MMMKTPTNIVNKETLIYNYTVVGRIQHLSTIWVALVLGKLERMKAVMYVCLLQLTTLVSIP